MSDLQTVFDRAQAAVHQASAAADRLTRIWMAITVIGCAGLWLGQSPLITVPSAVVIATGAIGAVVWVRPAWQRELTCRGEMMLLLVSYAAELMKGGDVDRQRLLRFHRRDVAHRTRQARDQWRFYGLLALVHLLIASVLLIRGDRLNACIVLIIAGIHMLTAARYLRSHERLDRLSTDALMPDDAAGTA